MLIILALINMMLLVALARAGSVTLAWDPNSPAPEGYRIFSRVDGQTYNYAAPAWSGATATCKIEGLQASTTYFFVARAFKGADQSGDSNEVKFIAGNAPAKQTGLNLSKDGEKMFLISAPVAASGADYYEVEIDGIVKRSDAQHEGDQVRLHLDLTGISNGDHNVRIKAVNGWGEGPWSDPFGFTAQLPGQVSGVGLSPD
jgi:hypothetical protein